MRARTIDKTLAPGDRVVVPTMLVSGGIIEERGLVLAIEPAPRASRLITVKLDKDQHGTGFYEDAWEVRKLSLLELIAEAAQ